MHAFALFHDDVMDDADSRRGERTTHRLFAARHADGGWAGEARRFGEGMAILIGDLAFVYSDQLMAGANADRVADLERAADRAQRRSGARHARLGAGRARRRPGRADLSLQVGQVHDRASPPPRRRARRARPVRRASRPRSSAYGLPLGDAFQMRDDVMGAFGDERTTGKPVGGDLREGKPTPLLARAVAAATPAQREVLGDGRHARVSSDDEVGAIQQVHRRHRRARRSRGHDRPRSPPRRSPPSTALDLAGDADRRADRARRVRQPARDLTCASS